MRPNNKIAIIPSYDNIVNAIVSDSSTFVSVNAANGILSLWDDNSILHMSNITSLQFHVPAEHSIDGVFYEAELHIVHKD